MDKLYDGHNPVTASVLTTALNSMFGMGNGFAQRDSGSTAKFDNAFTLGQCLRKAFVEEKYDVAIFMFQMEDQPIGHFVLAIRSPLRSDDLQIAVVDPAMNVQENVKVLREVASELNISTKEVPIGFIPNVAAHPQDLQEYFHPNNKNGPGNSHWFVQERNIIKVVCPSFT